MELKLNVKKLGIDFQVFVEVDKTCNIVKVTKVRAWDDNAYAYKTIPCDLLEFEKSMRPLLILEIEKIKEIEKI